MGADLISSLAAINYPASRLVAPPYSPPSEALSSGAVVPEGCKRLPERARILPFTPFSGGAPGPARSIQRPFSPLPAATYAASPAPPYPLPAPSCSAGLLLARKKASSSATLPDGASPMQSSARVMMAPDGSLCGRLHFARSLAVAPCLLL
ncbi:hypothetical protein EV356DRAFT_25950 [Viridothelium virens]|uniref:Uncharacterized protein n=1 Tax=Viridothelium virens TaxID=1048519 RepID=A0A6A6HGZ9_VIRVR|nr:hypothetical protein EV356DRAFT_25950 [Viridothelium virens]